jgi:hypothetical protein
MTDAFDHIRPIAFSGFVKRRGTCRARPTPEHQQDEKSHHSRIDHYQSPQPRKLRGCRVAAAQRQTILLALYAIL